MQDDREKVKPKEKNVEKKSAVELAPGLDVDHAVVVQELPRGSELLHRCRSREHRELRRYHVSKELDLFILGPPEFILGLPYAR